MSIISINGQKPQGVNQWIPYTECWSASSDGIRVDPRYRIAFVSLADGRHCLTGMASYINDGDGVFHSRTEAIRFKAAEVIRIARHAVKWGVNRISYKQRDQVITWARNVVARETGKPEPKPIQSFTPNPTETIESTKVKSNDPYYQIKLKQHTDQRWMWATSGGTGTGGYSYAPFEKWGNFTDTKEQAIEKAKAELLVRMESYDCIPHLKKWIDSLNNVQLQLI